VGALLQVEAASFRFYCATRELFSQLLFLKQEMKEMFQPKRPSAEKLDITK